jgi:hypothetical protein
MMTWVIQLPVQYSLAITLRWSREGDALRFKVVDIDIHDAPASANALFESHPWRKTG